MMAGGWWTFLTGVVAGAIGALLAVGGLWLVRDRRTGPTGSSAREELDRRYATGELSHEEYLRRRDDLG